MVGKVFRAAAKVCLVLGAWFTPEALLAQEKEASAPPDVRNTASIVWSVMSMRRSANVMAGMFDEPTKLEK